jgi:uncharacterized membrane protein
MPGSEKAVCEREKRTNKNRAMVKAVMILEMLSVTKTMKRIVGIIITA